MGSARELNYVQHSHTDRFVPDKEFTGTDHGRVRDGPVQFEKAAAEEDPFGLNQFLREAKTAKRSSDSAR